MLQCNIKSPILLSDDPPRVAETILADPITEYAPADDVAAVAGIRERPPPGITAMPEATVTATKPKARPTAASAGDETTRYSASFDMPKFELPKFEIPKLEVPAAFREFAEKGVTQAKDNWEKLKAVTEEATDVLEDSYTKASKGATDYSLKLIEASRTNANAAFDFVASLLTVKSVAEVVELSTAHARKQFDTFSEQAKDLTTFAHKVATETVEPIKEGVTGAFRKVA
jgi:phasin